MRAWTRRRWLECIGLGGLGVGAAGAGAAQAASASLLLRDFRPRSMLHVPETRVERPQFSAIDVHTHLTLVTESSKGVATGEGVSFSTTALAALAVMDRKGVRSLVNLTGGHGRGLAAAIAAFDRAHPGRFYTCTEPLFGEIRNPRYAQIQADAIEAAARAGAKGLKVPKTLGLYLRERITEGPLVKVDDPRFDSMWEACAAHGMPVFIHVADPEAFFLPIDATNERYDELGNHPDWSFHGRDFPSFREILEARDRVYARHPRTQFLSLHFGHNAENLALVADSLERFPNMTVELGARIGELGRQPRTARKIFLKHQDRILFGTDAVPPPEGQKYPQQVFGD
ncbi:MAG TPA: amidohydrolase family protein, partial [Vicinamibacteria bacterium]